MTIDEELSIIRDNIAEYGQTNITQEEYDMIYNKALDDAKSVILQTLDNEILVDTLHLRLEQLKERTEK